MLVLAGNEVNYSHHNQACLAAFTDLYLTDSSPNVLTTAPPYSTNSPWKLTILQNYLRHDKDPWLSEGWKKMETRRLHRWKLHPSLALLALTQVALRWTLGSGKSCGPSFEWVIRDLIMKANIREKQGFSWLIHLEGSVMVKELCACLWTEKDDNHVNELFKVY